MAADDDFDHLWDGAFDEILEEAQQEAEQDEEDEWARFRAANAPPVPRPIQHRRTIPRDHVAANQRLMEDYFSPNPRFPPELFHRRFRMSRRLFEHIAGSLASRYKCFRLRRDASGRIGLSTFQKCTVAVRQLAYGGPADMFDEYLHMGETTGLKVLRQFCQGIQEVFGGEYLREPNAQDCEVLLAMHGRQHDFPGMLGSIDCMHWEWRNCPTAWKGQFTSGFKGKHPTMILEAVADYRLRIWHAFFGVAGSNNDINVLQRSPLFNNHCHGTGPEVSFVANGNQYNMGYYLADGIYPRWPVFVKTINHPFGRKKQIFAQRQEAARKDVERAFGVLQSRWGIIRCPARRWHENDVADIMYACIILHNMIIDDEGDSVERWTADDGGAGPSNGVATAPVQMGVPRTDEHYLEGWLDMRKTEEHTRLQADMVEEIWTRYNSRR